MSVQAAPVVEHRCDPPEWEVFQRHSIYEKQEDKRVKVGELIIQRCKRCGLLTKLKVSVYDDE